MENNSYDKVFIELESMYGNYRNLLEPYAYKLMNVGLTTEAKHLKLKLTNYNKYDNQISINIEQLRELFIKVYEYALVSIIYIEVMEFSEIHDKLKNNVNELKENTNIIDIMANIIVRLEDITNCNVAGVFQLLSYSVLGIINIDRQMNEIVEDKRYTCMTDIKNKHY